MLFADQVDSCSDQVTDRTWGEQGRAPDELVDAGLKRSLPMPSRARDQGQLAAEPRRSAASSNRTE
ncbi:hypothetical protein [Streptomyces sp. NPDC058092]|uniref:hypothetical protein n=1 Tax=Streptomyces sp. NPDC058092 TaxID=3346336 RepID=UPI0036E62424